MDNVAAIGPHVTAGCRAAGRIPQAWRVLEKYVLAARSRRMDQRRRNVVSVGRPPGVRTVTGIEVEHIQPTGLAGRYADQRCPNREQPAHLGCVRRRRVESCLASRRLTRVARKNRDASGCQGKRSGEDVRGFDRRGGGHWPSFRDWRLGWALARGDGGYAVTSRIPATRAARSARR